MLHKALIVNILRKIGLVACCWMVTLLAFGQNEITFEAETDARQVVVNGYFEVTFKLKNANGTQFAPPSFKDFVVVAGPNTISSMNIVNGNVSREMGFGYTLQPTKVGKFTIGSASVKANSKLIRSEPVEVEVVKGITKPGVASDQQFFVRVEPNKKQAYVGEQVLMDFKLYTKVGIDGYNIPEDPNYDGFYALELRRFSSNTVQEELNGQQYATKILRRIALFPQKTGKLTVDPFRIQLAVVDEDSRTGFFFSRSVKPVFYTTDAVTINVAALPDAAPDGFSGAVGTYELQAGIDRKTATTDDAITLTLVLTGNGDAKRVQPPHLILSDSFEVYPPKVVGDKSDEVRGEIISEKRIEYLILPKLPGQYSIKPKVSYFSTEKNGYAEFSIGPFPLEVKMGSGRQRRTPESSVDSELDDILPIKSSANFTKSSSQYVDSGLFYLLSAIPLLAFCFLLFYRKKQRELAAIDPNIKKAKSAGREAQKRLATAQQQLLIGNSRTFYDEVSKAYLGYVCDKTGLPLSQFSKENVRETLSSLKIAPDTVVDFVKVIQTCEVALFAGMDNQTSMQTTYENAIGIITKIEDELSKNAS
ncbi:MAG: BatD family protein [Saprospiraceae bacterium]|nr:BatD family protein [Saprospiraceae bacterium]MCF8252820.1 BatD family protein [Saprospiraceae bacterium]MCF8283266.1 BatD family protein [Bacteroidales bacterium]MCF8314375.1 BatD family protein [Saprospiraceae bacterium]MCF8443256.1 BatD family protein [Saprospiraceae bacterium]